MDDRAVAIVLAGGQGSRIRGLYPDLPKALIPAGGRPFLEWILQHLSSQGIQQFVLSLGHLADVTERYVHERPADRLSIRTVREECPLGTGGGVKHAQRQAAPLADPLVVVNGDSLVLADFSPAWQLLADPQVDAVVLGVEVEDAARYGRIDVDRRGRLRGFREKTPGAGLINAGVYFFRRRVLAHFSSQRPLSMECDVFPHLLAIDADLRVAVCRAPFIDIGTPETAGQADRFIDQHFRSVVPL
jgi:NDP-sugar pyrophosphorylase family protein